MYEDYKGDVDFLTVYVREAHPEDEWQMKSNLKENDNVCYAQPKTMKDRLVIANDFTQRFHFTPPLVVDTMANTANDLYAAWPERLYVIDSDKRLLYVGGNGPFKFSPKEVRDFLAQRYGAKTAAPAAPAAQ